MVSALFDEAAWESVPGFSLDDVTYHRSKSSGTVRVAIDRPEVRNAFRPQTVDELFLVLEHARTSADVGCVLLTGNGPSPKDGGWAFAPAEISEFAARMGISMRVRLPRNQGVLVAYTFLRCSD